MALCHHARQPSHMEAMHLFCFCDAESLPRPYLRRVLPTVPSVETLGCWGLPSVRSSSVAFAGSRPLPRLMGASLASMRLAFPLTPI